MNSAFRAGIVLAALGALLYASGPLVSHDVMSALMSWAGLIGSVGLVLLAWGLVTRGGRPVGGLFWVGAAFVLLPRLVSFLDNVVGIDVNDGAGWISHLGLALGILGPVLLLVPVARGALDGGAGAASA